MSTAKREAWLNIYNDYYDWKEFTVEGKNPNAWGIGNTAELLSPLELEITES